jgi:hypothetical protein
VRRTQQRKSCFRDIIDLEATYAGPDAKRMQVIIGPDGKPIPIAIVAVTTVPGAPHLQIVQAIAPAAKPLGRSGIRQWAQVGVAAGLKNGSGTVGNRPFKPLSTCTGL